MVSFFSKDFLKKQVLGYEPVLFQRFRSLGSVAQKKNASGSFGGDGLGSYNPGLQARLAWRAKHALGGALGVDLVVCFGCFVEFWGCFGDLNLEIFKRLFLFFLVLHFFYQFLFYGFSYIGLACLKGG